MKSAWQSAKLIQLVKSYRFHSIIHSKAERLIQLELPLPCFAKDQQLGRSQIITHSTQSDALTL